MEGETVWLTKAQMAMLFGCSIDNISFAAHLFPLSHSVARTIPQANAVSERNLLPASAPTGESGIPLGMRTLTRYRLL